MERENFYERGENGPGADLRASGGDCEIGADRSRELDANGVGKGAVRASNPDALLDLTKEQFNLAALAIRPCYRSGGKRPLIGPEGQTPRFLCIDNFNMPHRVRPVAANVSGVETNRLIGSDVCRAFDRSRDGHIILHVRSLPDDEECARIGNATQAPRIHSAATHPIETARLDRQIVQPFYVRMLGWSDRREGRKRTSKIERHLKLQRGFASAPIGPQAERRTQFDQGGVHGTDRCVQIEHSRLVPIRISRSINQLLNERRKEPPVALLVRLREQGSSDPRVKSRMKYQAWLRAHARLYIAQALAKRHLREGRRKKVAPRGKLLSAVVLIVW